MFWKIIGISAACLTSFGFMPQIVKMLKTKSSKDVSIYTIFQFIIGTTLWAAYGIYIKDTIVIWANAVSFLTLIFALILCEKYKR